jgi:hypothetical protein
MGDVSKFRNIIYRIRDIKNLDDINSSARAVKNWDSTLSLEISDVTSLISRLKMPSGNRERVEIERALWHESLHMFEFVYDEIDNLFKNKYGDEFYFYERHGNYYEDIIQKLWKLETDLREKGEIIYSVAYGTKVTFDAAYKQYWGGWEYNDFIEDLMTFSDYKGVLISWGRIARSLELDFILKWGVGGGNEGNSSIDDGDDVSPKQAMGKLVFGKLDNKSGACILDKFSMNLVDTSNIESEQFPISVTKNGYTIYLTTGYYEKIQKYLDYFCITQTDGGYLR